MIINRISKFLSSIIDWGISPSKTDIENRSIRFTNVVFLVILSTQAYSFISDYSIFLDPQNMVWDQLSIPIMMGYAIVSLWLNRRNLTLFTRLLLLIAWPSITYIIPIIIQHTPTDYYVGYPIALIFHGFLIQITIPYRQYPILLILFMAINTSLVLTYPEFLIYFDDTADILSPLTSNKYYFLNGFTFWVALNLILAFLLSLLNGRIEEVNYQKNLLTDKTQELEHALGVLKERQEQLVHSEKMASLVRLSAGLAHEINNPLNYIIGSRDLLRRHFDHANQEDKEEFNTISQMLTDGVLRIQEIIHKLGLLTTDQDLRERFNLHDLAENCIATFKPKITDEIKVINQISSTSDIDGNPVLLSQILFQALANAIDAVNSSGTILLDFYHSGKWGKIVLQDDGEGIHEHDLPKVTDPFFTTKEPGKGTGLGLFILSSIVKELKGNLELTSTKNKGTTLIINFPIGNP